MQLENTRLQEAYRSIKEHSNTTTTSYRQQISTLEKSLTEAKNQSLRQTQEIADLRTALQDLQELHQEVSIQFKLVDALHKEDAITIKELRTGKAEADAKVARIEPLLRAKEEELKSLAERFDNYAKTSEQRFNALKQEYESTSVDSHEILRAAVEAEYITKHQEEETRVHHDLMQAKRRAEEAEAKCAAASTKMSDLQTEVNALQLRLRAYEAQSNQRGEPRHHRNSHLSALDIGSPVFSEDLGPVSIPHSIPNTPSVRYDFATYSSYEDESPRRQAPASAKQSVFDGEHHAAEVAALERENNKLKSVIKDVRDIRNVYVC